jgi:uncharacterized membrane protein
MNGDFWAKVHGATVHFPIALVLCSAALDLCGFAMPGAAVRRGLHAAAHWAMVLGAAGTVPAVLSGLVMSKGVMLGHDTLRLHHLFAWPAFGLIAGIGTWRALGGGAPEQRPPAAYLLFAGLAAALVMAAGYYGGEMLIAR